MKRRIFISSLVAAGAAIAYPNKIAIGKLINFNSDTATDALASIALSEQQCIASTEELAFMESFISDNENPINIARWSSPFWQVDSSIIKPIDTQQTTIIYNAADRGISNNDNNVTTQTEIASATNTTAKASRKVKNNSKDNVKNFDNQFIDDVYMDAEEFKLAKSVLKRLGNTQKIIGFGNFNLVSFDQAISYGKNYSRIGAFTKQELNFIEKIFNTEASKYGFFGEKVSQSLTAQINKRDTVKIPNSGHFLFKGESASYYNRLIADMGPNMILTSGIRSNVKQLNLFLNKCIATKGNISQASHSLAPPGHSYHGIGDFDVGKVGFGLSNFSNAFADTYEYKRMQKLGYVKIRYTEDNNYGVRFEPWHIKVV